MKKLSILVVLLFSLTSMSLAKKVQIDTYITATNAIDEKGNPCKFHVTGTVEFSILKQKIESYDITMSGPCGTYRFKGIVGPNNEIVEGEILNEHGEVIPIEKAPSSLYDTFIILEKECIKEQ